MVIFQILLLSDKRVISKERNTVCASNPRASLTWTDNTSKVGYVSRFNVIFQGTGSKWTDKTIGNPKRFFFSKILMQSTNAVHGN